jgi:hypothetical protein
MLSLQGAATLQESDHHDYQNDDEEEVDQVSANGRNECAEQPQEEQDHDDRFQSVTWHGLNSPGVVRESGTRSAVFESVLLKVTAVSVPDSRTGPRNAIWAGETLHPRAS